RHPFRKPSPAETLSAVLREPPDFGASIPQEPMARGLLLIIRRMLAKAQEDRYASTADVVEDLTRLGTSSGVIATAETREEKSVGGRIPLISRDAEINQLTRQL